MKPIKTKGIVALMVRQTPCVERASLLMDAYLPAERNSMARKIKMLRVARQIAKEFNPPPLVRRVDY